MELQDRESVKCMLCDLDETQLLYVKDSFNIVRCKQCGLIYVNPRPGEGLLAEIYRQEYHQAYQGKDFVKLHEGEFKKRLFEERIKIIQKYKKGGRILDVGCSYGYFLEVARGRGWDTYGIELSQYAADYAREKMGLNVFSGDVFSVDYHDYFDVCTLWHVLEHMPTPIKSLQRIHRLLKKDGMIVIETPNINCSKAKKQKESWGYLRLPEHLYYYTSATIKQLLSKCGFEIIHTTSADFGSGATSIADRMGIKGTREVLLRHYRYLRWLRAILAWSRKISRQDEFVVICALKVERDSLRENDK
ncbi:class I SAM-dependent methyltransferase [candidate division NPL-UPA2 bacterium]|nr:class I SAM-dependent methyltransferase [candidate division NPL-UPA2 bacterium]